MNVTFEWDEDKDRANFEKHGVSFAQAQLVFKDENRIIRRDLKHSLDEERWLCLGKVEDRVVTVRFIYRDKKIRIFGAGYWRQGKKAYEEDTKRH